MGEGAVEEGRSQIDKLKFVGQQDMIAFFFVIGTHFFSWGSEPVPDQMRCGKCGAVGTFVKKQGMRFITLFFIIPVLPISGIKNLLQCPVCGTKYQTKS